MHFARSVVLLALANSVYALPPCAVTPPPAHAFVPPPPYDDWRSGNSFYFGSADFWTQLPGNGVWETRHDQPTYDRRKIVWFSKDYWWLSQQESDLKIDARKLDVGVESVHVAWATNGFIPERRQSFMLNSIEFPSTGCWEISASWHAHELKFVVWVAP